MNEDDEIIDVSGAGIKMYLCPNDCGKLLSDKDYEAGTCERCERDRYKEALEIIAEAPDIKIGQLKCRFDLGDAMKIAKEALTGGEE
jgi:hypothetical protein